MCKYDGYDYFDYGYCYPRKKRYLDRCFFDLKPGDTIRITTGEFVRSGIFVCIEGNLIHWVDNGGNKSFSPINHVTITKLHGCGVFHCSNECDRDCDRPL